VSDGGVVRALCESRVDVSSAADGPGAKHNHCFGPCVFTERGEMDEEEFGTMRVSGPAKPISAHYFPSNNIIILIAATGASLRRRQARR
jgi:hypothetical protein